MLHTCTSRAHDKTGRSAARRFGVRAWSPVVCTRTNMRVTRTWYTRALVKLPLGGTVATVVSGYCGKHLSLAE